MKQQEDRVKVRTIANSALVTLALTSILPTGMAADLTRLLIPIAVDGQNGANGSRWKTSSYVYNSASVPVLFTQGDPDSCGIPEGCIDTSRIPPGRGGPSNHLIGRPGAIVFVDRANADRLHFTTRIFDANRTEADFGTEIPVVREADLHTTTLVLPHVAVLPNFRVLLRIYDPFVIPVPLVRVRVVGETSHTVYLDEMRLIDARGVPFVPESRTWPRFGGSAEIPLTPLVPLDGEYVRVEIEPLSPDLRFWAFVSITSNVTNHVTLVTPQ